MKYKGQYTNEIPYDGEFYEVYQLLFDTKLCKLDNLMAAYFLKWMKEKCIQVEHETVEGLFKRK